MSDSVVTIPRRRPNPPPPPYNDDDADDGRGASSAASAASVPHPMCRRRRRVGGRRGGGGVRRPFRIGPLLLLLLLSPAILRPSNFALSFSPTPPPVTPPPVTTPRSISASVPRSVRRSIPPSAAAASVRRLDPIPSGGAARMSSVAVETAPPPTTPRSFRDRMMRRLVAREGGGRGRGRVRGAEDRSYARSGLNGGGGRSTGSRRPPNVCVVETLEQYRDVVGGEDDRVVVVRFHATWCKACKSTTPLFNRLASMHREALFVSVPVTQTNANLHQGLGVPTLPYGHIYHPSAGLVEELRINRREFGRFAREVGTYVLGSCDLLEDGDCTDPFGPREEKEEEGGGIVVGA